ncbi:COG4695 Phage-related protein [uncultured Caudovirales phage]|uniref:COG4695 Phage-related protein n=1 Tax=uncultured Caudovirales phage TaxID=2100421 RepID=A0A6J5Q430_9CAUD|nr:COG4695 Phage-related protein [uncultured Caudovirales phage]CAB4210537.1 COG4695 Phage-related protein [uncultured Caudovirales phage]CAB4223493.1 COG4695 Phage-related protein [uncultured Caudovirales phage]
MGLRAAWRGLIGKTETKVSATGPVISYQKLGQPIWTPRHYEQFSEEGYKRNVVAYACIDLITKAAAAVPWTLYNTKEEEIDTHPLLKLLQRPNPTQGGASLMRNWYGYHWIAGNAYLEGVGPDNRPPLELYTHRPDRMKVVAGRAGIPQAFIYTVGQQEKRWDVDELTGEGPILHLKRFNPLNDWYGLSPLEAAAYGVDQHNEAGKWNQSLLQNSGAPSGALVYAPEEGPGVLTDDQFSKLKGEIDEKFSGSGNAGRPLLLEGGFDWKQMSLSPKEMDWLEGKKSASQDICAAFGVPHQMLGIEGSQTFANYEQARMALYEDTVLPFLDFVAEELNNWLVPKFGDNLVLGYDEDKIPALEPRRSEKFAMLTGVTFLTTNEKREAVGYEPVPGGDDLMVDATQLPLGYQPADNPQDPAAAKKMAYGD